MIIAIDTGKKGGIAWHCNEKVGCFKMPETPRGFIEAINNVRTAWDEDKENPTPCYAICYLEEIKGVPPNQSSKATWTFAEHYGIVKGILMALGIPIVYVKPNTWQKAIGATRPSTPHGANKATKERIKREGKRNIKQIVEARYPSLKITLATADALGILMYAEKEEKR